MEIIKVKLLVEALTYQAKRRDLPIRPDISTHARSLLQSDIELTYLVDHAYNLHKLEQIYRIDITKRAEFNRWIDVNREQIIYAIDREYARDRFKGVKYDMSAADDLSAFNYQIIKKHQL